MISGISTAADVAIGLPGHVAGRRPGEPVDLALLTWAIAGNFRSACEHLSVRLIVDCPPLPDPVVHLDRDAWERIVIGLVANALNETRGGLVEVRLRLYADNAELAVTHAAPAAMCPEPAAGGHGPGAARGGISDTDGLQRVSDLVLLQRGCTEVQQEPGRGITCTVRMPLAQRGAVATSSAGRAVGRAGAVTATPPSALPEELTCQATPPAIAAEQPDAGRRGRVVIVDDHADMRAYLSHVLEDAGYEVQATANGAAALAACQAQPPDAVISDVVMPALDGFALIERLRSDDRTAVTPVLLLSGRASEEARIEGLTAGADDFLVKPVRRRELIARVEGAIRRARMRAEAARRERADLESLFSMSPDGVIVVGEGGKIVTANERALQLFGYPLEALLRLRIAELMPENAQRVPHEEAAWGRPARLVSPIRELRAVRCDGSEFVAEVVLGPLQRFRDASCTIAIVRDITARRQLEEERAAQDQRFRELSHRLVEVQEKERRALSTELHDRTSPNLAAIRINLKLLGDLLSRVATADVHALLDDTAGLVDETADSIREISSNLRPTALDDGGLLAAVSGYAQRFMRRTGLTVHTEVSGAGVRIAPAVSSSVFRIVQEALTNCAKHAKARNVDVRLHAEPAGVSLLVADDGAGFDAGASGTSGLGLITMRERAEFAGGQFSLQTRPGRGTRIEVYFPARHGDAAAGTGLTMH